MVSHRLQNSVTMAHISPPDRLPWTHWTYSIIWGLLGSKLESPVLWLGIESFLCDSGWCDSVSRYDSGHYITLGFIRVKTRVTSILWLIMTHCTESQPYIVTQIMTPIMTRTYSIILWFINGLIRVTTRHITALTLWTLPFRTQIMTHS